MQNTVNILKVIELFILNRWIAWYVNYISIGYVLYVHICILYTHIMLIMLYILHIPIIIYYTYIIIAYSLGTMFLKFINVDTCITTLCILTVPLCREKITLHLSISLLSLLFEVVIQWVSLYMSPCLICVTIFSLTKSRKAELQNMHTFNCTRYSQIAH